MTEKKRFWIYIAVAFGGGWLLMGLGMLLGGMWYQGIVALSMFMPLLGVLLSHGGIKKEKTGISWMPAVVGNGRWYLLAWFGPAVLSILCAGLYFLLFPSQFDLSLGYIMRQIPEGTEMPFPAPVLALISLVQSVSYAPFLNAVLAVGEEAGWRGYLTPYLTKRFGRIKGLVLAGCIWAAWHWPLILLAGYEYGTGYPGAPFTGMLLMCVGCTAMGIALSFLYEKAGSIWAPALAHGAVNAVAGIGIMFLKPDITSLFLGPTILGLVAGIPLLALAAYLLLRREKTEDT